MIRFCSPAVYDSRGVSVNGPATVPDHGLLIQAHTYGCGGWRSAKEVHSFHGLFDFYTVEEKQARLWNGLERGWEGGRTASERSCLMCF